MNNIIIILLTFFIAKTAVAQDPHFTQYFASPLTLNPANTGKGYGAIRAALNTRSQWVALGVPFITSTASLDFKLKSEAVSEIDTWGAGLLLLNDKTGNNGSKTNYVGFSTSYHKGLDEEGYRQIGLGIQVGFMNKTLDFNKLQFGNQLTNLGYNSSLPSNETVANPNLRYTDINVGVMYSDAPNEDIAYNIGASYYHVNKPNEKFQSISTPIPTRLCIHATGYKNVSEAIRLHASGLYMKQGNISEVNVGSALAFNLNNDWEEKPTTIFAGTWYRVNEAFSPYFGLEFNNMHFGFSYDLNASNLESLINKRGGLEVSLVYNYSNSGGGKGIPCPKF